MLVSARALTVFVVAHNDSQKLLATIDRIYNALTVEDFSILIFDDGRHKARERPVGVQPRSQVSGRSYGQLARVYVFRNRLPMLHRNGWDGHGQAAQCR